MFFTSKAYAMGTPPQGGQEAGMGAFLINMVPILLLIVIFYFMLIRPQQKKAKEHKSMLDNLKSGDRIMTNGGFYGRIVEINESEAVVDLGEVKVTVARAALNLLPSNKPQAKAEGKKGKN